MMALLPPLPVVCPLGLAALLLAAGHFLPRPVPDIAALLGAMAAGALCAMMLPGSLHAPLIYWFGDWVPRHGFPLGIGFVVEPMGACMGVFIALLFSATFIFAWGYYDEVHAHFHVLMLLFLAGMIGFCLTHDLFDMFVWFEVMSIAGFALTGYQLRSSALEGAINFAVLNAIGSYLFLSGIGLLYLRLGVLDFSALATGVRAAPDNPLILGGFILIAAGLLIKGAQAPFHFWLSDAHAVAPSPVSVIFSGVMVGIGIFGLAKLCWLVFLPSPAVGHVIRVMLSGLGLVTVVLGGVMAFLQRHVKRLLAFSTISHIGVLLIGLATLQPAGLAGLFAYLLGHGLAKAALFMISGILLATCGGIDELGLRGMGRPIWPAGIVMAVGGLLLAGLPLGLMAQGSAYVEAASKSRGVLPIILFGAACTGGAVLRAAGRIFLGLGAVAGEEEFAPTDAEREKADRPLWLMLWPAIFLLLLAFIAPPALNFLLSGAIAAWVGPPDGALLGAAIPASMPPVALLAPSGSLWPWAGVVLAVALAGFGLFGGKLPFGVAAFLHRMLDPFFSRLQALHSGDVRDYVAWTCTGLALLAAGLLG